jgi:orotate phosphoribosyltransferase
MEKGKGDGSALAEVGEKYSLQTTAIVTMADVTEYLYNRETANGVIIDDDIKKRIDEYYAQYGAAKL